MSKLDDIYTFTFKGLLAEQALDSVGRKSKFLLEHSDEQLAKTLSLDLLDESMVQAAQKMAVVYAACGSYLTIILGRPLIKLNYDQLDKEVNGAAQDQAEGVKVALTQPTSKELQLAASRFPTEHMLDVIQNAKAGKRLFEARVFDGSDDGDKALVTTTVVGKQVAPATDEADAGNAGAFSKAAFWPVTISYFNENTKTDALPVYRMSFKLYENGITRDLTMDYGDFVLSGRLAKLELLDSKSAACK